MLAKISEISTKVDKKRVYTAAGALVVALAAGHVMQRTTGQPTVAVNAPMEQASAEVPPAPAVANITGFGATEAVVAPALVAEVNEVTPGILAEEAAVVAGGSTETEAETPVELAFVEPAPVADIEVMRADKMDALSGFEDEAVETLPPAMGETEVTPDDTCDMAMTSVAVPGALVAVSLTAPCHAEATVEFSHDGLSFTEALDEDGALTVMIPALTSPAMINAQIGEDTLDSLATVPDLTQFDRVALVWQGGTGLQLHALEDGAAYGEPGHVWAEAPRAPETATQGEGGFLTLLGSVAGGYAADIYTYPASLMIAPSISIEAQVTEDTCGTMISGHYIRSTLTGTATEVDVGMVVPGCEAIGEYLVLKNLPEELTIARN
ncbi:hypothetical protein [Maritimibacter sp. DP1N21-5]|uniref:hypothetical protein n=1 Tax=Maritimibacter sp. DP1N21-5 TaxID=2836867 RepID=UPI001C43A26E|nr:hypothetical protein [Maritimibacter sp. DP1N21-5]MBV7411029.1 hypothetical protein [Maritimibacter sp. DP1N21-5]